jgi:hypothetical protein
MNVIVMGFENQDRKASGKVLYSGSDKEAASTALKDGAPGIIRTEMYVNPQVHQRRSFAAPSVIVVPAPQPVQEADPAPEPEEEADPDSPAPLKLPKKGK